MFIVNSIFKHHLKTLFCCYVLVHRRSYENMRRTCTYMYVRGRSVNILVATCSTPRRCAVQCLQCLMLVMICRNKTDHVMFCAVYTDLTAAVVLT